MPTMANIVVKKKDGTTDQTYTAINPSGGDDRYAVWRNNSIGSAVNHRPQLRAKARDLPDGKQRQVLMDFSYKQIATNSTTTLTSVANSAFAKVDAKIPKGMTAVDIGEFAYQFGNLVASTLIKQMLDEQSAP